MLVPLLQSDFSGFRHSPPSYSMPYPDSAHFLRRVYSEYPDPKAGTSEKLHISVFLLPYTPYGTLPDSSAMFLPENTYKVSLISAPDPYMPFYSVHSRCRVLPYRHHDRLPAESFLCFRYIIQPHRSPLPYLNPDTISSDTQEEVPAAPT